MDAASALPPTDGRPAWLQRLPLWPLVLMVALLALSVLYVELPGRPLILHSLQKLGHPLVFALIATGLWLIRRHQFPHGSPLGDYVPALLGAIALGIVTELGQVVTHRDPALRDVLLDLRGIACALAALAGADGRLRVRPGGARLCSLCRSAAVVIALLTLAPLGWTTLAYGRRAQAYPVLFAPATSLDLLLVSLTDTAPELAALPAAFAHRAGERALRVPLTLRPYAGVTLDEPAADWRGHERIRLDVTNPARQELPLHVRIQDRSHDGTFGDRFEWQTTLPPLSRRVLEIPLAAVAAGPRDRPMDLGHMGAVTLYKVGAEGPRELWLGQVDLQ